MPKAILASIASLFAWSCLAVERSGVDLQGQSSAKTRFGTVEVTSPDSYMYVVTVDGKVAFTPTDPDQVASLDTLFHRSTDDVIVFHTACRCSDNEPPEYFFLIVRQGSAAKVLPAGPLGLEGGQAWRDEQRILLALGAQDAEDVTAELLGERVTLRKNSLKGSSLGKEECQQTHERVLVGECVEGRNVPNFCDNAEKGEMAFSLSSLGWLKGLDAHPGFDRTAFNKACARACRSGAPVSYGAFGADVLPYRTYVEGTMNRWATVRLTD